MEDGGDWTRSLRTKGGQSLAVEVEHWVFHSGGKPGARHTLREIKGLSVLLPSDKGAIDFGQGPAAGELHRHLKFRTQNLQHARHSCRSTDT